MVCFSSKSAYSCSKAEVTCCALSYALLALCMAASCDFAFPKYASAVPACCDVRLSWPVRHMQNSAQAQKNPAEQQLKGNEIAGQPSGEWTRLTCKSQPCRAEHTCKGQSQRFHCCSLVFRIQHKLAVCLSARYDPASCPSCGTECCGCVRSQGGNQRGRIALLDSAQHCQRLRLRYAGQRPGLSCLRRQWTEP